MIKIDDLLNIAVERKASDIHVVANKVPILRIDGVLVEVAGVEPLLPSDTYQLVFSILSERQKEYFVKDRELDISYEVAGGARFRVNCHWERNNVGLVARIISAKIPTLEELLMPAVVFDMLRQKQGLILVTGPTGCGKSTALAAMINFVNNERSEHIVTLEDPIEFLYESKKSIIKQRQLGTDMVSFQEALKHVLRQDPNVIMVGEMRDLETIAATITLAETGHLVMATLHTFNAAQTVDRIIDVFPPYQQDQVRIQLSLVLKGIIALQLLPRKSGGRIASREILVNTPAISNLIRENKISQVKTVLQTSAEEGMMTMDHDLKRLFEAGEITQEIAQAYMLDPHALIK